MAKNIREPSELVTGPQNLVAESFETHHELHEISRDSIAPIQSLLGFVSGIRRLEQSGLHLNVGDASQVLASPLTGF
jgi:hypothetical protein